MKEERSIIVLESRGKEELERVMKLMNVLYNHDKDIYEVRYKDGGICSLLCRFQVSLIEEIEGITIVTIESINPPVSAMKMIKAFVYGLFPNVETDKIRAILQQEL